MNNNLSNRTVCIAGLGYVGLPLALCSVSTTPDDDRLRRGRGQDPGTLPGE